MHRVLFEHPLDVLGTESQKRTKRTRKGIGAWTYRAARIPEHRWLTFRWSSERSSGDCLAFTTRSRSISGAERSFNDALYVCIYDGSDRETVINTVIPALTLATVQLSLLFLLCFLCRVWVAQKKVPDRIMREKRAAGAIRRRAGRKGRERKPEEAVPTGIVTVSST